MIRRLREFRLIPIVLGATACLFVLKMVGLMLDGGYLFGVRGIRSDGAVKFSLAPTTQELTTETVTLGNWAAPPQKDSRRSWMQEMFGFPDVTGSIDARASAKDEVSTTGSASAPKSASKEGQPTDKSVPVPPKPTPMGTVVPLDGSRPVSVAERAILERLHERRQELDKRARELEMRENMLKESETRLDARMNELKALEVQAGTGGKRKEDVVASRYKSLAIMYENMKAKDAAKIFDRLDIKVLIDMSSQINPRRMAEIMGLMNPDAAERLTNELAARASGVEKAANPSDLPKIEGRPSGT